MDYTKIMFAFAIILFLLFTTGDSAVRLFLVFIGGKSLDGASKVFLSM